MIQYTIGEIIKRERKAQRISQEKLAEGICTPSWLSKIETGACIPTIATFELLMQRLGKATSQYICYKSDLEIQIEQFKFNVRRNYALNLFEEATKEFNKFKALMRPDYQLDLQFELLYSLLLEINKGMGDAAICLEQLYTAIHYSIEDFDINELGTYLLTQEEVVIINNIAIQLRRLDKKIEATDMLLKLKDYLEDKKYEDVDKIRIYPVVLANLSKWQGIDKDFIDCLKTCEEGIAFCLHMDAFTTIHHFLFNKAYTLIELESYVQAEKYLKQAYYILQIRGDARSAEQARQYGMEHLQKDVAQ